MIRFHYFKLDAPKRIGRIMVSTGSHVCHVYSTDGIDELLAWGRAHGFPGAWLQDSRGFLHFIAWGRLLRHCGESMSEDVFQQDVRAARRPFRIPKSAFRNRKRPCCGHGRRTEMERRNVNGDSAN